MLNSSRINNSPRTNNTNLYNNINETANGLSRTFIQPKITSTPLVKRDSIFATPPKQSILSPRRYSLSEIATPPRSNRRDLTKIVNTGPLLAATGYNVNVSTYEDTKSPGLASRIVQYNEETEREREYSRPPTHQAKYGSPGLFPVVHLFKKKLPVLEQKPRRVTIRIASPDYSRHHSQEYNRKLLEGIVRTTSPTNKGSPFSPSTQSSSSTRSVLDALKEISRKRIHANEEYDLNEESGKRLRTMPNEDGNKRQREDSPLDKSPSPSKPTSKRACMYDEYAASCSSTDFSFKKAEDLAPKRKSISISTLTDNPKESKQVKLINAETQTIPNETPETAEPDQITAKENGTDNNEGSEVSIEKKKSPLKIFDDAPLERIRKNRLAALMGSLTGKEPVLLPKPDYATMLDSQDEISDTPDSSSLEVPKSTEKTLVSILSSPKKPSPSKSNKHVHFSVPESTSQTNFGSTTSVPSFSLTPIPPVVTVAVSSTAETNPILASRSTPAPPSSPVGLSSPSDSITTLPVISFSGGGGSNSSSATSVVSKESSTSSVAPEAPKFVIPNFQFNPPATSATPVSSLDSLPANQFSAPSSSIPTNFATPAVSSPPKMGGFKFDLSKPVTSSLKTVASTVPTFSFGGAIESGPAKVASGSEIAVKSSMNIPSSTTFSFGPKPIAPATTSSASFSFGTTTTSSTSSFGVSTTSVSPASTFKFGPVSNENKTPGFALAQSNATTFGLNNSGTPSAQAFGTSTTTSVVAVPTTSAPAFATSKAPFFAFGAPKTTSPSAFGAPANTTAPNSGFGAPANTAPSIAFGTPSATSGSFGAPASNFLNTSTSLPAPNFGAATTASALTGGFAPPSTTLNASFNSNAAPMFGANKTASPFAVTTAPTSAFGTSSVANSSPFGKTGNPQFGQNTTQSAFGTPTTTVSFGPANSFGVTTTTTSSSVFGGANNSASVFAAKTGSFGAPTTNSNIFGGPVNSQPSGFGPPPSKPMFGPSTTSPFGTTTKTTTAPFGSTATPSFNFVGKTTTTSSFGTTNSFGTTTAPSAGFGNPTAPAFGTPNSFSGSNFANANAFGGSNPPAFRVATTSSQPSGFGATNTPSFGNSTSNFNAADKNSAFGNSSGFGNPISSPFGPASNAPGFGTNAAVSAFTKPQTTQNAFGAPNSNTFRGNGNFGNAQAQTPNFGATNAPNTQNTVFSFGATVPPKPPGIFSFGSGAPSEVPKPTFNFTGGITAPPAFGSSGSPAFGTGGAPPPFGSTGIPQFNAPQAVPQGMFSIGSGSSTGKSRTHLKPKRRT